MLAQSDGADAATLRARPAGYSVVRECLQLQSVAVPRTRLAKLFGVRPVHTDAVPWFAGALGEIRVGQLLSSLDSDWTVLHAVPVGTGESDIDHVVIGPAGVFTINTKHHRGQKVWLGSSRLLVAGQKTDHLRNSRHEAKRASKLLSAAVGEEVAVTPLLTLVGVSSVTVKERPDDVVVLTDSQLLRWLKRRKPVLDDAHVARLATAASDVRTWHKTEDAAVDDAHMPEFARLQAEDAQARTRRLGWVLAGMAAIAVAAIHIVPAVLTSAIASLLGR